MRNPRTEEAGGGSRISIIIPVLHEEAVINGLIAHIRSLERGGEVEIVVVDGDAGGSTIRVVKDGSVRTLSSGPGRGLQMNSGAAVARGDILLFLHADTQLPENALSTLASNMRDARIMAGAFDLGFDSDRRVFRITEAYVFLRTRLTRIPFGDQAIFARRRFFETIGGYQAIPVMEDVDLMRRIKQYGVPIAIIPEKTLTSPRRYEEEGLVFCTLRNWALQILYLLGVSPDWLAKWYRKH